MVDNYIINCNVYKYILVLNFNIIKLLHQIFYLAINYEKLLYKK